MTPAEKTEFDQWWRTYGSRICSLLLHPDMETKAALRVSALEAFRHCNQRTTENSLAALVIQPTNSVRR